MNNDVVNINSDSKLNHPILKFLPPVSLFLLLLLIYIWSMPRTVVLEDDGLFILAAYFNGFAHPPGYPLYTLIAHMMTWVPIDSVAFRVHLTSAIFGSLGALMLYWIVRVLIKGKMYAYLAGLSFGISNVYWSQSIVAEVYTLNIAIVLLLLILALKFTECDDKSCRKIAVGMGLLYGLGLCNHWPLLILSSPMLLAVVWPELRRLARQLIYIVPMLIIGLSPYLWMVIRSKMSPEISFYGPMESWSDFWFFVSREGYSELDISPTAGWKDKLYFCGFVLQETSRQFGALGMIFIIIGFISQWREFPKNISFGLLLGYLGSTFILIFLLGFDYEYLHTIIFRVYPLVAYSISGIWLVLGVKITIHFLGKHMEVRGGLLSAIISILVVGLIFSSNIESNYRAKDNWAPTYAKIVLDNIPENAIVFTDGDLDLPTLGYLNKIQNYRQDITLYSSKGILFSNRLFTPGKTSDTERVKILDNFIKTADMPVYYTWGLPHIYGVTSFGLFNKVETGKVADSRIAFAKEEIVLYIKDIIKNGEPYDPWEKMHYLLLLSDYCNLSLRLMENSGDEQKYRELLGWVDLVCNTYQGQLSYVEVLLKENNVDITRINSLLENAKALSDQIVIKSQSAMYPFLVGELNMKTGDRKVAIENYNRSIQMWPHPDNPAFEKMRSMQDSVKL